MDRTQNTNATGKSSGSLDPKIFTPVVADRLDQIVTCMAFLWLCWRFLLSDPAPLHWYAIMLLASEGVIAFFVIIRRRTEVISVNLGDWVVALSGTALAMLVENQSGRLWPDLGFALILVGFVIHFGAKLSLRRSFGTVPADRGIKTNGLYALVRHPMYFGYMISHIGFFISVPSFWNAAVYILAWTFLISRIMREERLLLLNPEYAAYAEQTRYRFIPGVW